MSISQIQSAAAEKKVRWAETRFSPDDIAVKASQFNDLGDDSLRFSHFKVENIAPKKVDEYLIRRLLSQFAVVDDPKISPEGLNQIIFIKRRDMLNGVFARFSKRLNGELGSDAGFVFGVGGGGCVLGWLLC